MTDTTASDLQELLQEPYWSLDAIIRVGIVHKFPDLDLIENSNEVEEFNAELLNDVIQAIIDMTIQPVDLGKYCSWDSPHTYYYEKIKLAESMVAIYMLAYCSQKMINYKFPAELQIISNDLGYDLHYIFQDVIFTASFVLVTLVFLGWWLILRYQMIRKKFCKTPLDKIKYLEFEANIKGITENHFVSDNAIDFLNMKYSMHIPKDPFRVWKEPFFKRSGDIWIVGFQGKRVCLENDKNIEKIAYLLSNPNKEYSAIEFVKGNSAPGTPNLPEFDKEREYQKYKTEMINKGLNMEKAEELINLLKMQIQDADGSTSAETILESKNKIEHLEQYISDEFLFNGKDKPPRDSNIRSQESLEQAIKRFIKKRKNDHPAFAEHLKFIRKSSTFCYRPPDDIKWDVRL